TGNSAASCSEGHVAACSFLSPDASRISIGLLASESRRQVTCSPSFQRILTETPLAHTIRPSTPSSLQRTRLPILSVCRLVLGMVAVSFLLLIIDLLVSNSSLSGPRPTALLRRCQDTYLDRRRHSKLIQRENRHCSKEVDVLGHSRVW